jgi:hypothetical protein
MVAACVDSPSISRIRWSLFESIGEAADAPPVDHDLVSVYIGIMTRLAFAIVGVEDAAAAPVSVTARVTIRA